MHVLEFNCRLLSATIYSPKRSENLASFIVGPYFVILLCLMPDDFTCQGERSASLPLNLPMHAPC
jgi:hypothetical protein